MESELTSLWDTSMLVFTFSTFSSWLYQLAFPAFECDERVLLGCMGTGLPCSCWDCSWHDCHPTPHGSFPHPREGPLPGSLLKMKGPQSASTRTLVTRIPFSAVEGMVGSPQYPPAPLLSWGPPQAMEGSSLESCFPAAAYK